MSNPCMISIPPIGSKADTNEEGGGGELKCSEKKEEDRDEGKPKYQDVNETCMAQRGEIDRERGFWYRGG